VKRAFALAAFGAFLAAAPVAAAQDRDARTPGKGPKDSMHTVMGDDGQKILNRFADCAIASYRPLAEQYLAEPVGSYRAKALTSKLKVTGCNTNIYFITDAPLLRGALYEAMFLIDFREGIPSDLGQVAAIDYAFAERRLGKEDAALHRGLLRLAECVSRQNPAGVAAVLRAEVGSPREIGAFSALKPSFGPCLYADQSIAFSRTALRGFLAETLYRLSTAARQQGSATTAAVPSGTN
jgi:hypothetical protein